MDVRVKQLGFESHFVAHDLWGKWTGLALLEPLHGSLESSGLASRGAACFQEVEPGKFQTVCIVTDPALPGAVAFPASVAESMLGITFGPWVPPTYQPEEREMEMPVLTTSGFEGRRLIIDSLVAKEHLIAGAVVAIHKDGDAEVWPNGGPRVHGIRPGVEPYQAIGIVQTPEGKVVGDKVAGRRDPVAIVVKGVAQAYSVGDAGVGDPVTPASTYLTPPQKSPLTTVKRANPSDVIVGRSLSVALGQPQIIDVLVDIAGIGGGSAARSVADLDSLSYEAVNLMVEPVAADCWYGLSDQWESGHNSIHVPGKPARFCSFFLEEAAEVHVFVRSVSSARLFLLEGTGPDGTVLAFNEDAISGGDSEIIQALQPGRYTVEVTANGLPSEVAGEHFLLAISQTVELSGLMVTPHLGSAEISWNGPAALPPNCAYRVVVSRDGSEVQSVEADSSPVAVQGLEAGASYSVSVSARFDFPGLEDRAFSNTLETSFSTNLPSPAGMLVNSNVTGEYIGFYFEAPAGVPDGADYLFEFWDSSNLLYSTHLSRAGGVGYGQALEPGTYTVKLATRVVEADGSETLSEFASETITTRRALWSDTLADEGDPVPAPSNLTISNSGPEGNDIRVQTRWDAPSPQPDGFGGYALRFGPSELPGPRNQSEPPYPSWSTTIAPYEGAFPEYTFQVATKVVDTNGTERFSEFATTTFSPS